MSDRIQPLRKRIAQLEAEVRALRKQAEAQLFISSVIP